MSNTELVIVTGASSGVGKHVVLEQLEAGKTVIGVSRTWRETIAHDRFIPIAGDVADKATWAAIAAEIDERPEQRLTGLVINAAKLVVGPLLDVPDEEFEATFAVNVFGAITALRTCAPRMIAQGGGSIVFVASTDALFAEQDLSAYCTSKGALIQLMRSFAVDYALQGIRTNAVCPGAIDTPFFMQHVEAADDPDAFLRTKTDRHPSGRILQPEDVSSAVSYLLSDRARGFNGASLLIDGGLTTTFDFHPPALEAERVGLEADRVENQ